MNHSGSTSGVATTAASWREVVWREALISPQLLDWFIRMRWAFVVASAMILAGERFVFPDVQRPPALGLVVAALAVTNMLWIILTRRLFGRAAMLQPVTENALSRGLLLGNAQVAADLLLLTCILRFTGGVANPLAVFYLFHMALGALVLRPYHAIAQGVWAIVLYAALGAGEASGLLQPAYAFLPGLTPAAVQLPPQLVLMHVFVLGCGVLGTLHFTLSVAARLKWREHELRRMNAALRQSQTAIQDLQLRRSRFMQTAAHQLKSPLAVIQTLAQLVADGVVPSEAIPDTCEKITRRCSDGIQQVTELLTLARVQEASPERHGQAACDVGAVVLELCHWFSPAAERKRIDLSCRIPEGVDLQAHVDPMDLRDCLSNLIENAIKYTSGPGIVGVLVGRSRGQERPGTLPVAPSPVEIASGDFPMVTVTVADSGMGIDPEVLRSVDGDPGHLAIFDDFRRGNNALAAGIPGSGLGLSIVREVVEHAGGRIGVHSRPGYGSTFTVTFPAVRGAVDGPGVINTRSSEIVIETGSPGRPSPGAPVAEEANHAG